MFRLNRARRFIGEQDRTVEHTLACVGLIDGLPELRFFSRTDMYRISFDEIEYVEVESVVYEVRFIPFLMRVLPNGTFVSVKTGLSVDFPEDSFEVQVSLSQHRGFGGEAVFHEAARSLGYVGYRGRRKQFPVSPPSTMVEDALREMVWMSKMIDSKMDSAACTLMGW